MEWRSVKVFPSRIEGEMALEFLRSFGVEAKLKVDDCGGTEPPLAFGTGAAIWVREVDREKAEELLNSSEVGKEE